MAQFGDFTVDRNSTKYVLGSGGTIISYATDEPAFEFNADGSYKGLLVEPAATNLCKQSEDFSTTWTPSNVTIATNATTAPDGTTTADEASIQSTTASLFVYQDVTGPSTGYYTFSIYAKDNTAGYIFVRIGNAGNRYFILVDLSDGSIADSGTAGSPTNTSNSVTPIGDGWYRISVTANLAGTAIRVAYTPYANSTISEVGGTPDNAGGSVGDSTFVWGAQLETGPIATSYIPTTTASVTRNKDDITLGSASSLIGQTEGTLYVEVDWRFTTGVAQRLLSATDGTFRNRVEIYKDTSTPNELRMRVNADGNTRTDQGVDSSGFSGIQKFALAYKTDDFELYRNGSSISSDTSGSLAELATITDIDIGQAYDATEQANMHIRAVALYPTRLSDAEAEALTTL